MRSTCQQHGRQTTRHHCSKTSPMYLHRPQLTLHHLLLLLLIESVFRFGRLTFPFFAGGLDRFCPKNMGRDRREDDRCRNRSAVSSGFLSFFFLTMHDKYFSFIILKMLFFIFWPLPKKLLDCPKKIFCPTLGGCSSPAHTPMNLPFP